MCLTGTEDTTQVKQCLGGTVDTVFMHKVNLGAVTYWMGDRTETLCLTGTEDTTSEKCLAGTVDTGMHTLSVKTYYTFQLRLILAS